MRNVMRNVRKTLYVQNQLGSGKIYLTSTSDHDRIKSYIYLNVSRFTIPLWRGCWEIIDAQ